MNRVSTGKMETFDNNQISNQQAGKRSSGMTFFLILSLINACFQIISSIVSYFALPTVKTMIDDGQFEEIMAPFFKGMDEEIMNQMIDSMTITANTDPNYYLILFLLFIGSLIGVLYMFKLEKRGFHIYSISQICMLINSSVYIYPRQEVSGFTSDLLSTILFILLYYLYFKRLEQNGNGIQEGNI